MGVAMLQKKYQFCAAKEFIFFVGGGVCRNRQNRPPPNQPAIIDHVA